MGALLHSQPEELVEILTEKRKHVLSKNIFWAALTKVFVALSQSTRKYVYLFVILPVARLPAAVNQGEIHM